jgi:hypothetical protein
MCEGVDAMRVRKKPVEVDAVQWRGDNTVEVEALAGANFEAIDPANPWDDDPDATAAVRDDLHGGTWIPLYDGDWIVRGVRGEMYPVRGSVFAETYEVMT